MGDASAVVVDFAIHGHTLVSGFLFFVQGIASCSFPFAKIETKLSHSSSGNIGRWYLPQNLMLLKDSHVPQLGILLDYLKYDSPSTVNDQRV